MTAYGKYLNPERRFRIPRGIKFLDRTKHTITHNPSKTSPMKLCTCVFQN